MREDIQVGFTEEVAGGEKVRPDGAGTSPIDPTELPR